MKAKVIAPVSINGSPRQIGEVIEVDANTFANLVRKGRLQEAAEVHPQARDTAEPQALPRERKQKK